MLMTIQTTWYAWAGLFSGLPYGDPYLAFATLFILVITAAKIVAGGEPA
jgi:hypothetical protein